MITHGSSPSTRTGSAASLPASACSYPSSQDRAGTPAAMPRVTSASCPTRTVGPASPASTPSSASDSRMLSGTKIAPSRAHAYITSKARKQPRDSITTRSPRPTPNERRSIPATHPIRSSRSA